MLRRALGDTGAPPCIETVPRRGYRFAAAVSRAVRRESDEGLAALLAPHRAWLEGRSLLETLDRERVQDGRRRRFVGRWRRCPISLRRTSVSPMPASFDSKRHVSMRHRTSRRWTGAVKHAREACRLEPGLAEVVGDARLRARAAPATSDALAASRRAVGARARQLAPSAAARVRRLGRGAAARLELAHCGCFPDSRSRTFLRPPFTSRGSRSTPPSAKSRAASPRRMRSPSIDGTRSAASDCIGSVDCCAFAPARRSPQPAISSVS